MTESVLQTFKILKHENDSADRYSRESTLGANIMIDQFINGICSLGIAALSVVAVSALHIAGKKKVREYQKSVPYYVFKVSRITGHSEYDVFCKSAEEWPVANVTREKIDADFRDYLGRNAVPPYVNHFIRQNKHHIDELHLPPL